MNNFWIVLWHTYFSKIKTKSFIVTTAITLLIIWGLTNLGNIIAFFDKDGEVEKIAVIDETGMLFADLENQLKEMNSEIELHAFSGKEEEAILAVENEEYQGLLVLSLNEEQLPEAVFKSMTISDFGLSSSLQNGLQQMKSVLVANQLNLSGEQLAKLNEPVLFERVALEEHAKTEAELNAARGLVYALLFVIYMAVIMYANMIAMEVATEKSSRVMEILISSVSPIKLMFAKIVGIGLVSLTQFVLMIIVGYLSMNQNMAAMQTESLHYLGFGQVPVSTMVYAIIFFILGYFLYATLAAFLGSLVSRIEDVQQMITPMTLLVVAGFLIAMLGLANPDAPFVTITSYIPFFTPMLMFMRVGMLTLPVWEPIIGIIILLISIIILAIFGARVYKGGVLMYGNSNSFKDIKKALQLTKNE